MTKAMTTLAVSLLLAACASRPTTPSLLVLPGSGKTFAQFQSDELLCKQHASVRADSAKGSSADLQEVYDMSYIQCMFANGNRVPVYDQIMYESRKEWHPPPPPPPPPVGNPAPP